MQLGTGPGRRAGHPLAVIMQLGTGAARRTPTTSGQPRPVLVTDCMITVEGMLRGAWVGAVLVTNCMITGRGWTPGRTRCARR